MTDMTEAWNKIRAKRVPLTLDRRRIKEIAELKERVSELEDTKEVLIRLVNERSSQAEIERLRTALAGIANTPVPGWKETPHDTRYLRLVDHARESLKQ